MELTLSLSLFLAAIAFTNWYRLKVNLRDELIPNCLLTNHAILFITGHRSIFYFLSYWNWIPRDLRAHGYEVYVLNLPWRKGKDRLRHFQQFLDLALNQQRTFHVVADDSSSAEVAWLEACGHSSVVSCTMVNDGREQKPFQQPLTVAALKPARLAIRQYQIHSGSPGTFKGLAWRGLIGLHNVVVKSDLHLRPGITGVPTLCHPLDLRRAYLQLAVSLAEQDVRCSS